MRYFIYAPEFWGEEKTLDYLRKLSKQNPTFCKGATYSIALLAAGEFPISVGIHLHRILMMQEKGAPIEWAKIDRLVDTVDAFAVMRHARHPNAAKLFLYWWMSPEGISYVDSKRHKGNPLPGYGTRISKILEKYGSLEIYIAPAWLDIDQKARQKKYLKAIGYTKAREKIKKKK